MFEFFVSNWVNAFINFMTMAGVVVNIVMFIRKNRKENSEISIVLDVEGTIYRAKYPFLRKFVQRSEIKGVLRDLLIDQNKGFSIKYLSDDRFITNVLEIQKGKGDKITIKCSEDEFKLFDKKNFEEIKDK